MKHQIKIKFVLKNIFKWKFLQIGNWSRVITQVKNILIILCVTHIIWTLIYPFYVWPNMTFNFTLNIHSRSTSMSRHLKKPTIYPTEIYWRFIHWKFELLFRRTCIRTSDDCLRFSHSIKDFPLCVEESYGKDVLTFIRGHGQRTTVLL